MNLHSCGQLVYDKGVKNIQGGKTDSSTMLLGKVDSYMPKQNKAKLDYSEKAMATHSSTLAWKILWTERPARLQSMGSQTVGHD